MCKLGTVSKNDYNATQICGNLSFIDKVHTCFVRKQALEENCGYKNALYMQCCHSIDTFSGYAICKQLVVYDNMHNTTYITNQLEDTRVQRENVFSHIDT